MSPQLNSPPSASHSAEAVGQRLGQLRINSSLSQAQMAAKLRISTKGYQNYERGKRELPSGLLVELHDEFDADPLWVLTGVDTRTFQWTPEALEAIKGAVRILETALAESHAVLEPELKALWVAHLVQHGITNTNSDELMSLITRGTK